jgi:hypothetical protein
MNDLITLYELPPPLALNLVAAVKVELLELATLLKVPESSSLALAQVAFITLIIPPSSLLEYRSAIRTAF